MRHTAKYDADILAVWGACGQHQWQAVQRYRADERRVLCLDVGYFNRSPSLGGKQQIKIALNDPHPEYLPDAPPDRFDRLALKLTDVSDPNGPVIVAGLGVKSRQWLYGHTKPTWEKAAIAAYRNVIYRPKGKRGETLPGVQSVSRHQADIAKVLTGASLAVSRHSNVCHVDAPLLGIPVVVETGPSRYLMSHDNNMETRRDYLRRLAWWSWSLDELRRGEHWEWVLSH